MKKNLPVWILCAWGGLWSAQAQWVTQTLSLKAGWNAVFLHVDATHATLDQLIGAAAPIVTPIEQVWRWNPNPATHQFIQSPQQPVDTGSQWSVWRRSGGAPATLDRLTGNTAYLVYSTADYSWQLKGQPALPSYRWSTSGLNFFGFPTVPTGAPSFEDFLAEVPSLQFSEIFQYPGGEFGANNPRRVFALRTTPVRRGEAFWIRAGEVYNHYFGPFEVTAAGSGRVAFGDTLSSFSFRLRNQTAAELTVTMELIASEAPPTGQPAIVAVPPLLLRGPLNTVDLTYGVSDLPVNTPQTWTLAPRGEPGSEAEIVLGLDRAAITANVGDLLAGVLRLTDSRGHSQIDLAVSAQPASRAGLWVGAAAVTEVGQYLQSYLRDSANQLVVQEDGRYVVTEVITNLTAVPEPFPLRLIVHNPATGPARLMQRVYHGYNAATNPIVANLESALARNLIAESRRVSASHLPWSDANQGWSFSGGLAQDAVIVTTVTTPFNDQRSNPFLHTYHPDHDNLDARFRNELPRGSESYTLVREITLAFKPPANDFNSRVSAGLTLGGDYLETLRVQGLARGGGAVDERRFDVKGVFQLNRVSDVPTLTLVP
ncbi:MAG: hypothetical protein IPM17_00105 [Verrucomicrobia bacterium]|nr:hypothetical protein [Verrucomicrobiota bacterium]